MFFFHNPNNMLGLIRHEFGYLMPVQQLNLIGTCNIVYDITMNISDFNRSSAYLPSEVLNANNELFKFNLLNYSLFHIRLRISNLS